MRRNGNRHCFHCIIRSRYLLSVFVEKLIRKDVRSRYRLAAIGHLHLEFQYTVFIIGIQWALYFEICHPELGLCIKINIPFESAQTPEVLAFQIIGIRETMNLHGNHVFTRFHKLGDIEAGRSLGIFTHSCELSVQIKKCSSFSSVGTEKNLFSIPIGRKRKITPVGSCRIPFLGYIRRIGPIPIRGISR